MSDKQEYILKSGKHSYVNANGERVVASAGDRVPLTFSQFQSFKDKFRSIEQVKADEATENADAKANAKSQSQTQTPAAKASPSPSQK